MVSQTDALRACCLKCSSARDIHCLDRYLSVLEIRDEIAFQKTERVIQKNRE
jgi:hypothetical protein